MSKLREQLSGEVQDLLDVGDGLSAWEINFIESMSKKLEDNQWLSDKMIDKIREIWDEHCA